MTGIDLGDLPLANDLPTSADAPIERWPLCVLVCEQCLHGQLESIPQPEVMFTDYRYFSSTSRTMVQHACSLVERYVGPGQRVLEIASNDGYLLVQAQQRGARVLGVDPARNIATLAEQRGVPTITRCFDRATAQDILTSHGQMDVIFALNVLAHVPDPHEIAAGISTLLTPGGMAHVEVPSLAKMLRLTAFDTIYHEHASYFSLHSLRQLFAQHDLVISDVQLLELHCGSFHITVQHAAHASDAASDHHLLGAERSIADTTTWQRFASRLHNTTTTLNEFVDEHDTIAGYGAAAKATMLLNLAGVHADRLPWVADGCADKQGRFIPGTAQRIVKPQYLTLAQPDLCIIFPWNIFDEIVAAQQPYLQRGGCFARLLPEPHVVARDDQLSAVQPAAS